ncbi:MAG TPA: ATP-dependent 6-phosphofructokinase [Candidatus Methylacidiphilales bacterium]
MNPSCDSPRPHFLGAPRFPSPLARLRRDAKAEFKDDLHRVLPDNVVIDLHDEEETDTLEMAGPRRRLFFNPGAVTAAIVTCGGLCPGLNDVIRGLVRTLYFSYGVPTTLGIRHGFAGFVDGRLQPMALFPALVSDIHLRGGSILGCSRGPQDVGKIVDCLVNLGVDMLFVIGGDGTFKGATEIVEEIGERNLPISVIGIPKTIDNDLEGMDKSFGFETAFAEAVRAIRCAHSEAKGYLNGIGLVKLMGRESGFIAASAALAENSVNFVIVPEVPFSLDGPQGLLACLERRLARRSHAVIVVAEGAGAHFDAEGPRSVDASGNVLPPDVGLHLRDAIGRHFRSRDIPINLKYIDPSYVIRSIPASPQDSLFCIQLSQEAVHAAMAGKTGIVVGQRHGQFVHLPFEAVTRKRRRIDPAGDLWLSVLESTGQPVRFG